MTARSTSKGFPARFATRCLNCDLGIHPGELIFPVRGKGLTTYAHRSCPVLRTPRQGAFDFALDKKK